MPFADSILAKEKYLHIGVFSTFVAYLFYNHRQWWSWRDLGLLATTVKNAK
ncbi:hypothetical protein IX332_000163 [Porphyromonas levii]|nr:hypothetical protein [Porphyromonas levii]